MERNRRCYPCAEKESKHKDRLYPVSILLTFTHRSQTAWAIRFYIVPHCCCSLARCIDFISCICFFFPLEKVPSSSARFSVPAHLEIVNRVIVQLRIRNRRSQMHLDARYLTWNRTHVINKGAVFLRCNSCEFSETPRRRGLRQHQGVLG